jgi:hypothetical protein
MRTEMKLLDVAATVAGEGPEIETAAVAASDMNMIEVEQIVNATVAKVATVVVAVGEVDDVKVGMDTTNFRLRLVVVEVEEPPCQFHTVETRAN